jgi:hypothetical protein
VSQPQLNLNDFVILTPRKVRILGNGDMPPDRFYLVSVLEDRGDSFDFEILDSGPCALVEALAISACKKGQQIWFPLDPFGDNA